MSPLKRLWKTLSSKQKQRRWEAGQHKKSIVLQVRALMAQGEAEASAVSKAMPPVNRSTFRSWARSYDSDGLEGLIDRKSPPPQEAVADDIRQVVCSLRRSNQDISVTQIANVLRQHHGRKISETTIKRILHETGLARKSGRTALSKAAQKGRRLHLGGMKLIEAAAMVTGYLDQLTASVVEHLATLDRPPEAAGPDVDGRDELGRFSSAYNERYRKQDRDAVGPGFLSVDLKRRLKDPDLLHACHTSPQVIERKLWALLCSPMIGSGSWDGMRTSRGGLLEELCGYAYMPSTLQLFTGELKYSGVGDVLWEAHARVWHTQTQNWGTPRYAAVLYVDATTKPIWTQLFSQSTHVSLLNRTMPGLDVVGFHNGYGVPLWYLAHSGCAPLVKVVPEAITKLEESLGEIVARIVVIDAEGNSVPFLSGLEKSNRGWATRLRPSMLSGKEITNWSSYSAYRNDERIREGEVELRSANKETLKVRLIEIERNRNKDITYLAASMLLRKEDWKTDEVADLYFDRWPNQENNFKAVNQAADLKQVHGYGKQLVTNVSVVTQLEILRQRTTRASESNAKHIEAARQLESVIETQKRDVLRLKQRKKVIDASITTLLKSSSYQTNASLRRLHEERLELEASVESAEQKIARAGTKLAKAHAMAEKTGQKLRVYNDKYSKLQSMTHILSHDVELDSIFNAFKVGLTMLVTYVLTQILGKSRLEPTTFLERVGTLPAWQQFRGEHEYLTFDYNARDPSIMALLISHCEAINAMNLPMRSGRVLRVAVDESTREQEAG
jgi:transposase